MATEQLRLQPYFVLWAVVIAIALFVVPFDPSSFACQHPGDSNVIGLSVEKAKEFAVYLGPYSRHRFFHPGPFFFYLYAAADYCLWFLPQGFPRFSVAQALLNFTLVLLAQAIVARLFAAPLLGWLVCYLVFAIFPLTSPRFLSEIWGPTTLLCPMVVFLLSAAGFSSGRVAFGIPFAVSGSLLVSNHLGAISVVFPLAALTILASWRARTREGKALTGVDARSLFVMGFVLCIFWCLPFIDFVKNPLDGNVSDILNFLSKHSSDHSLFTALVYVGGFAQTGFMDWIGTGERAAIYSLLTAIVSPYLFRFARASPAANLRLALTIGYGLSIYAAMRIKGDLHSYILGYLYAMVVLTLFLVAYGLTRAILNRSILRIPQTFQNFVDRYRWWLHVPAALFVTFVVFSRLPSSFLGACPVPNPYTKLVKTMALDRDRIFIVRGRVNGGVSWGPMSGMMYALKSNDYRPCVDKRWGFVFGKDLTCAEALKGRSLKMFTVLELVSSTAATPQDFVQGIEAGGIVAVLRPASKRF